jgi:hypothetical protein
VKPNDAESADREVFLQEQLEVPLAWIAEAKAMCAASAGDYGDQVRGSGCVRLTHQNPRLCKFKWDAFFWPVRAHLKNLKICQLRDHDIDPI